MRKKVQILFHMEVFIGPILCIPFKDNTNAKGLCTMMGNGWWATMVETLVKGHWNCGRACLAFVGSFNYILMAFPSFPLMPYAVLSHTVWLGPFVNSFINNTPAWLLFSFTLFYCPPLLRYLAVTQPLTYSKKWRCKRLAMLMILGVWLLAFVITCPPLFGWWVSRLA